MISLESKNAFTRANLPLPSGMIATWRGPRGSRLAPSSAAAAAAKRNRCEGTAPMGIGRCPRKDLVSRLALARSPLPLLHKNNSTTTRDLIRIKLARGNLDEIYRALYSFLFWQRFANRCLFDHPTVRARETAVRAEVFGHASALEHPGGYRCLVPQCRRLPNHGPASVFCEIACNRFVKPPPQPGATPVTRAPPSGASLGRGLRRWFRPCLDRRSCRGGDEHRCQSHCRPCHARLESCRGGSPKKTVQLQQFSFGLLGS